MSLDEYRSKRDFGRTPEPAAKAGRRRRGKTALRFVVQKHAARRLHYDFRLEWNGALKSWAVPKGPCLDPAEKRLAVHVEDHPLAYADFEGTIPEGEYGAGTVLVWDRGTWIAEDADPESAFQSGLVKFRLEGEKLRGRWMLVRMKPREGEKGENWLLVKEHDDEVRPLAGYDVLDERPESVVTGKTVDEVAAAPERTWSRGREASGEPHAGSSSRSRKRAVRSSAAAVPGVLVAAIERAVPAPFPEFVPPQLASPAKAPPEGDRWLHEIKFDGYRLLAFLNGGRVVLRTRTGIDWTHRFPELAEAVAAIPVRQAVLDGEVVAQLPTGASNFAALQSAFSERDTGRLAYFVFDLLYLDGYDLRGSPLLERKRALAGVLAAGAPPRVQFTDHLIGHGDEFFRQCRQLGLEGIVSKRVDRPASSGRGEDWLKFKSVQRDEFVIGGFTPSAAAQRGLRSILVGAFTPAGELIYVGKVGTGLSEEMLHSLRERLMARQCDASPFVNLPAREAERGTRWVRPELVAQVAYANRSRDGMLFHPVFDGLREDKPAEEVVSDDHAPAAAKEAKGRPAARGRKSGKSRDKAEARVPWDGGHLRELECIRFTSPERLLYPEAGITKLSLASFYAEISDWLLPHIAGRLLNLVRSPDGVTGKSFYQKHEATGTPDAIHRVPVVMEQGTEMLLMIDDLAGLLSLVQMSVLEIHPWGARVDDIERPDRIVFDLDPDASVPWPRVVEAAREVRARLKELKLVSFVKTTGGAGLHVVLPLQRRQTWDDVKAFVKRFAERMAADAPSEYTASMVKAARRGRIYIDYLRNARGSTAVAPYSTRARPGAPVSTPLSWNELTAAIRSDQFHVGNLRDRLASLRHDPWEGIDEVRQSLNVTVRRRLGL